MAKSIQSWLSDYGQSHKNPVNKGIHWVCVPVITWTVLALMWSVAFPIVDGLNLAMVFIVLALLFYARLSLTITFGMALFTAVCVAIILWHERAVSFALWQTALALFVVAWVFQFVGHKIEGQKPSFFEDIQFLLIGPAWLLGFIYAKLGVRL